MAIPKISKQNIDDALKFIDEKGVPSHNQSTKYELVTKDGKKYPPEYVIAVAAHMANGAEISTKGFDAIEAKSYLQEQGFNIEIKQFTLKITADGVTSNDKRFTMDNLGLGYYCKPKEAYFEKADGEKIKHTPINKQTMSLIACQVFEKQIAALSVADRENFPISQCGPSKKMYQGIYTNEDEFREDYPTRFCVHYKNDSGSRLFVLFYDSRNLFSNIIFVQECLKRFGEPGDKMVLIYCEKDEKEKQEATTEAAAQEEPAQQFKEYRNPFSSMLIESKNLIFRGAPGTGKSYLAKEIAADIISNGQFEKLDQLSPEQRKQVEFVQFHPSYDYTDFVEGIRPKVNDDGTMGFELQDGIFKKFIARARKNYEDSQKSKETELKKYVFIIDEINRGEISKIFGELFFSIDPEYRGRAGEISTQYSNLHADPDEKFYIPENVYIIGTMNDIDRSVDSFDFAMRRRFRFVELKADERLEMLSKLENEELENEAKRRIKALNNEIAVTEDLNENYQIGASYFLKLKTLTFDQLWTDYLRPLLQEYIRGMYDEEGKMNRFAKAYGYKKPADGDTDEAVQD
ncbi:McrB family protein [Bifidobacterium boum]|uniref:5-methylcytosine specific endonuclease n=1 Tax=Bifidobacterium boum TaxID=78343 RepID=A0A086ZPP5_9BIFI|nr:AAA family ATPase [Bifidobacterium boum]KFI48495.1 5-methylcytosine specific endonuclease [Bifidobacterium boum]